MTDRKGANRSTNKTPRNYLLSYNTVPIISSPSFFLFQNLPETILLHLLFQAYLPAVLYYNSLQQRSMQVLGSLWQVCKREIMGLDLPLNQAFFHVYDHGGIT